MELTRQQEIFAGIEAEVKQLGLEYAYVPGAESQLGQTLRFSVPMDGEDLNVLVEAMTVDLDGDTTVLQIYTTLLNQVPSVAELEKAAAHWNLYVTLGHFGIYYELKQLYHRYNVMLPAQVEPDDAVTHFWAAFAVIIEDLNRYYPVAAALAAGATDYETAVRDGLCP